MFAQKLCVNTSTIFDTILSLFPSLLQSFANKGQSYVLLVHCKRFCPSHFYLSTTLWRSTVCEESNNYWWGYQIHKTINMTSCIHLHKTNISATGSQLGLNFWTCKGWSKYAVSDLTDWDYTQEVWTTQSQKETEKRTSATYLQEKCNQYVLELFVCPPGQMGN